MFMDRFIYVSTGTVSDDILDLKVFFLEIANYHLPRRNVLHASLIDFKILSSDFEALAIQLT